MNKENKIESKAKSVSRRRFLTNAALLGGTAFFAKYGGKLWPLEAQLFDETNKVGMLPLTEPENIINSVCLNCNTQCPIKVQSYDGIVSKIDGNPYSPQNLLPHLDYSLKPEKSSKIYGKVCPKGQAGVQIEYDPYRIRKVLKRAGKRGENKWIVIPFSQAIDEIVNGGYLFKHVKGEEHRKVKGFRDVFVLKDPAIAKSMAEDVQRIRKKELTVTEFKKKYKDHLDVLIDPDHPDFGPKNNRFVFQAGRIEPGRSDFTKRFVNGAFGSINWFEHTTICEQSHHIAFKYVSAQYDKGVWKVGTAHMKPNYVESEFVIFWGTGAFEANFGPPPIAEQITKRLVESNFKIAVIDPRLSKTAAKAWKWIPVKPGDGDNALAMGMIRWILENDRYDKSFLSNANKAAASSQNELSWTNATWLVKIENGHAAQFLRASEIGLGDEHTFVTMVNGKPTQVNPYSEKDAVYGDLYVDTEINGKKVKSAFQILKEAAFEKSLDEYAVIAGVAVKDIEELAREFTGHGKKAAIDFYRGAVKHTNGYYTGQAIVILNLLIGNVDWKGGLSAGGGAWSGDGSKEGQPFDFSKLHPKKLTNFGLKITREGAFYEESTLYNGRPAKRQWYPFTSDVYQEIIPAAYNRYPYGIDILWLHMATPTLAAPAGHTQIKMLMDLDKLPLVIADDIVIGETSMYADYIFPDLSYLERWAFLGAPPSVITKTTKVRQPAATPVPEIIEIDGYQLPISLEAVMIAIAKKLDLPSYGKNGFGNGMPLDHPEDYYLKAIANIAAGDKPGDEVPEASDDELEIFLKARRHLPKAVFDEERWKNAVGQSNWRRVVYVLNRGGRYESYSKAYKGNYLGHPYAKLFNIFVEPVAKVKNAMTLEYFSGVPIYEEIKDSKGNKVIDDDHRFYLTTYKDILGGQSRTLPTAYWLSSILPENTVIINAKDARELGLKDNDIVKIVSSSNVNGVWPLGPRGNMPIQGKLQIIEGIRPGTVAVSWSFGHWAYGSNDVIIDGKKIKGDMRRKTGLCSNAAIMIDSALKDVSMSDPIGGSASFFDSKVNIVKV